MLDTITMAKRLNGEYKTVFEKVEIYGMVHEGETENKDEKMMEIFDILLEAQNENKPIEKIVGKDLELFCKNFFEEKVIEEKISIKNLFGFIFLVMEFIFIWALLDIIIREDGMDILSTKSDITMFFIVIPISIVTSILTKKILGKLAFKNKKITPSFFNFWGFIFTFVITFISMNIVENIFVIKTFLLLLISSVYIMIYVIFSVIWRYRKYGKITKVKKENDFQKFNKELKKYSDIDFKIRMVEALVKKFKRWNKSNKKRGKPELTFEQLCEKKKRESKLIIIFFIIFCSLMVIVPSVIIAKTDTFSESLIFGVLVGVIIESFLCWATIAGEKEWKKILNECEKQEIDIIEYAERLKK